MQTDFDLFLLTIMIHKPSYLGNLCNRHVLVQLSSPLCWLHDQFVNKCWSDKFSSIDKEPLPKRGSAFQL